MKAVFLLFIILFSSNAFADIKVKIYFSPIANLVYQLDCLSGEHITCSKKTYEDLWKKEFYKKDEDKEYLKEWGDIQNRYDVEAELKTSGQSSATNRYDRVQLLTKIRIASFQSSDMEDYFNHLDLIILPKDREKFEKVIRHFYPRFKKWWENVALSTGNSFAKKTDALLKRPDISKKLQQYASFYQAELPEDYTINFNLFYRPFFKEGTGGQQLENYSVAEFLPTEKPSDRIDVIIHELCHFFFASAIQEKLSSLQKKFEMTETIETRSSYNLLNETLATALGNGIITKLNMDKKQWKKYFSQQESFYNNYFIDKAAKAILPWLEDWIKDGKTLYDPSFVEKYNLSLESAFGNELTAPKLLLNKLVLVVDNKFDGKLIEIVGKEFNPSEMYEGDLSDASTLKLFNEFSTLSSLLIVHSANINLLKEKHMIGSNDYNLLTQAIKKSKNGIFSFKKIKNVPVFVIVASSYDEALKLIVQLAGLKKGFNGVLDTVE